MTKKATQHFALPITISPEKVVPVLAHILNEFMENKFTMDEAFGVVDGIVSFIAQRSEVDPSCVGDFIQARSKAMSKMDLTPDPDRCIATVDLRKCDSNLN